MTSTKIEENMLTIQKYCTYIGVVFCLQSSNASIATIQEL